MGFYGLIPIGTWMAMKGFWSSEVQEYLWKMVVAYIIFCSGGLIYVAKVPERWFPGRVTSLWVQSHILWHICVTLGCLWLYKVGWDYYFLTEGGTLC